MLTMRVISVNTDITGIAAVLESGVFHAAAKKVMVDMAKRPAALDHANRMDWVERVTTFCTEQWGLPPITGRILGWLMICDPAEQSAGQIAEAIGASRASLTANIRQLTAAGFVRRRSRPGERTTYFWIDDDAWERAMTNLADAVAPGGYLIFTEHFFDRVDVVQAGHNRSRGRSVYETALIARGLAVLDERPTHHLMNRELGALRFLNRVPELLYRIDLALLTTKLLESDGGNRLVLARRPIAGEVFRP